MVYQTYFMDGSVRIYALVDGIEHMGGNRIAVQFDAIASDFFDKSDSSFDIAPEKALAMLRIVSTHRKLCGMMEEDDELRVGEWVELVLEDLPSGTPVWMLELRDNVYQGFESERGKRAPHRTKLNSIRRIAKEDDSGPFESVGAAANPTRTKANRLTSKFDLTTFGTLTPPALINHVIGCRILSTTSVEALDVGQASFNTITHAKGNIPLIYFDVGKPLWFHVHNFPSNFEAPFNEKAWVILSHWDSDHYLYGREDSRFHNMLWVAPAQSKVGPNAHHFAKKLWDAKKLILVDFGRSSRIRRGARIIRCSGDDINGSGIALHLRSLGREILLTGDANYDLIPSIAGIQFDGVLMPHHGAALPLTCPIIPSRGSAPRAIASYGKPNRYRHPNLKNILRHLRNGWQIRVTADCRKRSRGAKKI